MIRRRNHFRRNSREVAILLSIRRVERQRYQSRPALYDFQSKLPLDCIAERGRTHLRNRQSTCRDRQRRSMKFILRGQTFPFALSRKLAYSARSLRPPVDTPLPACLECPAPTDRRTTALASFRDRESGIFQRAQCNPPVRIVPEPTCRNADLRREKVLTPAMNVGEIASSAAGDQDFLADPVGMIEHRNAAPAPPGLDGAHQPRGPGA